MKDKTFNDKMMIRPLDDKFEIECLPNSFYRDAETFRIERDLRTTIQKLANYAASQVQLWASPFRSRHYFLNPPKKILPNTLFENFPSLRSFVD